MDKQRRTILVALFLAVTISTIVVGTSFVQKERELQIRSQLAYQNPVTIDLWKIAADPDIMARGWSFLGLEMKNGIMQYHYQYKSQNIVTTAGLTWLYTRERNSGAGDLAYIALSTDATAPARGDTSLIGGEVQSGGLTRASGVIAGSGLAGTTAYVFTIVYTFTALTLCSSIQKAGLFSTLGTANQPTMFADTTFAAVNLAVSDTLTITWTISAT